MRRPKGIEKSSGDSDSQTLSEDQESHHDHHHHHHQHHEGHHVKKKEVCYMSLMHLSIFSPRRGSGGHTLYFRHETNPDRGEFDTPNDFWSQVIDFGRILWSCYRGF